MSGQIAAKDGFSDDHLMVDWLCCLAVRRERLD